MTILGASLEPNPDFWDSYRDSISLITLAIIFLIGFLVGRLIWRKSAVEADRMEREQKILDTEYQRRAQIFSRNQEILDEIWGDDNT